MSPLWSSITVLFAASVTGLASAQILFPDYRCRIEDVAMPGLTESSADYWRKQLKGKEFSVERRTGLMAGALKNSYDTKPDVIDRGSNENSFKVVTTLRSGQGVGPGSYVLVLIVREYVQGSRKPFTYLENDRLYSGICEHF